MDSQINIHPDDTTLAGLARSKETDDAHLQTCIRCRMLVEFYRGYFQEEAKELSRPVSAHDLERVSSILTPGIHRLLPYQIHLNAQQLHGGESAYLLAALNMDAQSSRFQPVASFASESIRTVVRVLRDARSGNCTLYVLSDDRSFSNRIKIGINDIKGHQVQIETDEEGVGSIDDRVQIDWKNVHLYLITPPTSRS